MSLKERYDQKRWAEFLSRLDVDAFLQMVKDRATKWTKELKNHGK